MNLRGELGARETRGVKLVRVRLIVLLGDGFVHKQCFYLGGTADRAV